MPKREGKLIRARAFTDSLTGDADVSDDAGLRAVRRAQQFAYGQRAQGNSARIYDRVITADNVRMDVIVVIVREKGKSDA